MKSDTLTVQQIFQDRRQYRVPFYQRPYVWNREDQWERLWSDVQDKADARLQGGATHPHFMGAVVLEPQQRRGLIGVERLHIIDGQQRLTTLQYVLCALAHCLRESGLMALLPLVDACRTNPNPETMEDKDIERFKLWPTFRDRGQYLESMTADTLDQLRERFPESFRANGWLRKIGVEHPPALEAIWYFREQIGQWLNGGGAPENSARAEAVTTAILCDLSIVCISLGEDDDAQIIFETLNGHGAELNATDLIRNFIFMRAGTDADQLYSNLWAQFEASFWSESQTRGRLRRPRLEWFVQTALQAEAGDDIDIGRLYSGYRRFAGSGASARPAAEQLEVLNRYAEHYRALVTGIGDTPIALLGRRMTTWDASTIHPLALRIADAGLEAKEQQDIFDDIESYFVRRAVCRLPTKNYNKVFAQQLKKLAASDIGHTEFRNALAEPTGDASRWPRDDEFRRAWLEGEIFPGRLDAARLRTIFHRLETAMRSARTEENVPLLLENLDVDHILPQSWYAYWRLSDGQSATLEEAQHALLSQFADQPATGKARAVLAREQHVPRIGNLTLIHYGVNRGLQNRAFGEKRQAFFENSNLQINRALMLREKWDEVAIQERGELLFEFARKIWRGPT